MKLDARLTVEGNRARQTDEIARLAESLALGALWTGENKHDAFLPLALAAQCTSRIQLGTAVAIAFSRSPMVVAQLAWDLQRRSNGRFLLGLGTQVRAHIVRRFSMPWGKPAVQLEDYVGALRAIWTSFQTGSRLSYEGPHYQHTLITPTFDPGPIEHPHIPVYVSGVGSAMARSAGRYADGFHVHPFHSPAYIQHVLRPSLETAAVSAGRALSDIELSTSVFTITGDTSAAIDRQREDVRTRIAFYASTPSYRPVLEVHGFEDVGEQLTVWAKEQRWSELPTLVNDEMLDAFAVEAAPDDLGAALARRYDGLLDRVSLFNFLVPEDEKFWRGVAPATVKQQG